MIDPVKRKSLKKLSSKTKPLDVKIGDLVDVKEEVRAGKFSPYYHGPYEVVGITEKKFYT